MTTSSGRCSQLATCPAADLLGHSITEAPATAAMAAMAAIPRSRGSPGGRFPPVRNGSSTHPVWQM